MRGEALHTVSDYPNSFSNNQPEDSFVPTTNYRGTFIAYSRGICACLAFSLGLMAGGAFATTTDRDASPTYRFSCTVARPGLTSAGIFDAQGRLVRVLWTMKQVETGAVVERSLERARSRRPAGPGRHLHLEGGGQPLHVPECRHDRQHGTASHYLRARPCLPRRDRRGCQRRGLHRPRLG